MCVFDVMCMLFSLTLCVLNGRLFGVLSVQRSSVFSVFWGGWGKLSYFSDSIVHDCCHHSEHVKCCLVGEQVFLGIPADF